MLSNRDLVDLDLETYAVIRNLLFLLFSRMTQIFYELYTLHLDVLLNRVLRQRVAMVQVFMQGKYLVVMATCHMIHVTW